MLAPLSWGCDDDDKGDRDCHDKRDCDDHNKPCHPPKIQSVDVDLENNEIVIHGKNFDSAGDPVVTLGGKKIDVLSHTGNEILATFEPEKFPNTDYRLVVSTCRDSASKDKYWKDYGSKCKDKDDKDDECRCRDRYSLTIAGPAGPPSAITLTRKFNSVGFAGIAETTETFDLSADCQGGLVTGGGFSCPKCGSTSPEFPLRITVNEPLEDLSGWHVAGAYVEGPSATLTIYAICAQGK
jgi:hypothetical protein